MAFRVIQWATGNVGRAAIEGIVSHPELELAGVWVHGAAKEGRDAGEICGLDPLGVEATRDADALLALEADCVLYSPLLARTDEVLRILESSKNVVTPLGWFYPYRAAGWAELEAACRKAGVTLHGTGIHPGGVTERIPLVVSSFSRNVTRVRAEEFSDIRSYAAEAVVRDVMLFGKPPEIAAKSPMLDVLGNGFKQSIDLLADALDFDLDDEKPTKHEMAIATRAIETPVGVLEKGTVAAQRFAWQGTVGGEPVIEVITNWLMGEENLDPAWSFGAEGERFEVEITGDPPVRLSLRGLHPESLEEGQRRNRGIVATAMNCVNAIPYVCRARPGIRSYLDLPLMAGRAHPSLR